VLGHHIWLLRFGLDALAFSTPPELGVHVGFGQRVVAKGFQLLDAAADRRGVRKPAIRRCS
jgi:hypothetical protein